MAEQAIAEATPPSLRMEILEMIARRDRKLGDELLAKLDEARKQVTANASTRQDGPTNDPDSFGLPSSLKLRIMSAQQLLDTDVALAIEVADPALTRVRTR